MANISNITYNSDYTTKSAILDGIQFNHIAVSGTGHSKLFYRANNIWNKNTNSYKCAVNAVDIDWNDAQLPNGDLESGNTKTITTTGDLLSLIDKMNEEIYVLSAAVIALGIK